MLGQGLRAVQLLPVERLRPCYLAKVKTSIDVVPKVFLFEKFTLYLGQNLGRLWLMHRPTSLAKWLCLMRRLKSQETSLDA